MIFAFGSFNSCILLNCVWDFAVKAKYSLLFLDNELFMAKKFHSCTLFQVVPPKSRKVLYDVTTWKVQHSKAYGGGTLGSDEALYNV